MSESGLWLNYALSAAIAFLAVYFRAWRLVPAMLVGTAVTLAIWLVVSLAAGGTVNDPWLAPSLVINGSFSLIFAGVGAGLGYAASALGQR